MKTGILTIFLIVIGITTAHAGAYESPFGFTIDLPARWNIVNQERLKNALAPGKLKKIDQELLDQNIQAIREGKAEIYYDSQHDFIFVQGDRGGMKPYKAIEKQLCNTDLLQKAFSKSFGRPVRVYACHVIRVSRYDAVYTDFDGAKPGTRSLQYQIWKPSNDTIILTLTAETKNLKKLRDEFTALVYSLEVVK